MQRAWPDRSLIALQGDRHKGVAKHVSGTPVAGAHRDHSDEASPPGTFMLGNSTHQGQAHWRPGSSGGSIFRAAFVVVVVISSRNAVAVVVLSWPWNAHRHTGLESNRVPVFHMPHITLSILRAAVCGALAELTPCNRFQASLSRINHRPGIALISTRGIRCSLAGPPFFPNTVDFWARPGDIGQSLHGRKSGRVQRPPAVDGGK